jgi:hypothetical protein
MASQAERLAELAAAGEAELNGAPNARYETASAQLRRTVIPAQNGGLRADIGHSVATKRDEDCHNHDH